MSRHVIRRAGLALLLAGCQPADSSLGVLGDTGGIGSAGPDATGTSIGEDTLDTNDPTDTDDTDSADDGLKLDVGAPALDIGGGCPDGGCACGAVDLLFVVDNSVAMGPFQQSLAEAFPELTASLLDQLPDGTSLRVGVTSTTMGVSGTEMTMGCVATGDGGLPAASFYETPDVSDNALPGAQGRLAPSMGMPYFELPTDPSAGELEALSMWFSDAVDLGEDGSQIEMLAAAAGWVADPINEDANDAFIRDGGAVLAIVFVSDAPDQTPIDEAEALIERIETAKTQCGGMGCVVGGGFVEPDCLTEVALGGLLDGLARPPAIEPLSPRVDAEAMATLLAGDLATAVVDVCDSLPQ